MKNNTSLLHFFASTITMVVLLWGASISLSGNNFINNSFWTGNPSTGDIVTTLFGTGNNTGTQYTTYRQNNTCVPADITVQHIATNSLPTTLTANTIYVLTGNQELTQTIDITQDCIAIIGSGDIYITAENTASIDSFFRANTASKGLIIDGIYASGGDTAHFLDTTLHSNITIQANTIHDFQGGNTAAGVINIQTGSENIFIHGNNIYNSDKNGITIVDATANINIINNKIFNHAEDGINIADSAYIIISNNIIHNNNNGIHIGSGSYIVLDTIQAYNNSHRAIHIAGPMNNSILHNLRLIHTQTNTNNNSFLIATGNNNRYYGSIQLYGSTANISIGSLLGGVANNTNISQMGRTNGTIQNNIHITSSGSISCALGTRHTNMLDLFIDPCKDNGPIHFVTNDNTYHYGTKALKQSAIPYFSGNNLYPTTLSFNPELYIADNHFGGWIQTTGGTTYTTGLIQYTDTDQLLIYASEDAIYSIRGYDVQTNQPNFSPNTITGTIQSGQTKTITLPWTGDNGYKVIMGQLSTGTQTSNIYQLSRRYDTTGPDQITLINPTQNQQVTGNQVTLEWSAGVDTGAGISGYNYQVASDSGFTNILFSGTTNGLQTTFNNIGFYPNYYRQVQGFDNLGNTGVGTTGVFHYGFSGFVITVNNTVFPTNSGQTFTVTAYDIDNNIITGYTNTVSFTITGVNTTAQTGPVDYTFSSNDNGTKTFTGGLNIDYPGVYTITVQDTLDSNRSGSTTFTVTGQASDIFSGTLNTIPSTVTSGIVNLDIIASSYPITYDIFVEDILYMTGTSSQDITTGININNLDDGTYTITVIIYDDTQIYSDTMTTDITLDTLAPVVTITQPTNNTFVSTNQPFLSWESNESATYIIVMSGSSQVYTSTNQPKNSYRQGTPLPDDTYTMTIYASDIAGNIGSDSVVFTIDNTPPVIVSGYPHESIIQNPITFMWNVVETGGIDYSTFWLMDFYGNNITNATQVAGPNTHISVMDLGLGTLAPGVYKWNIEVKDKAGLASYTPNYDTFIFAVHNALPGQIQGFMEFQSAFGNIVKHNGNIYTNTTQLQAALFANMASNVSLQGDINPNIVGVPLLAPYPYTLQAISLTPGDGTKNINAVFSSGNINPYSVTKQIILDTTPPTPAQLVEPANNSAVQGDITIIWNGGVDTGAGIDTYVLEIAENANFSNIIATGAVHHPIQTFTIESGQLQTGTYYRRVQSYDRLENNSTSEIRSVTITKETHTTTDPTNITPDNFTLNTINNATPNLAYKSNTVTVSGLPAGQQALAHVSAGTLFINGDPAGTTGLVVNGDIVEVELIASSQYNTQVSSTLGIGTRSANFNIKTINQQTAESYNGLTNTQRFQIRIIFDALVDTYGPNDGRTLSFFTTLRTAIESMLSLNTLNKMQEDALEFFLTLVNNYINSIGGTNTFHGARYEARNGRVFTITFDPVRTAYTSPEFIRPAFFASWSAMRQHIDIHNPGSLPGTLIGDIQTLDSNRGADVEVMPNGKIYRIEQKQNNMRYSPDTISGREFGTRSALISWLRANNQRIGHF